MRLLSIPIIIKDLKVRLNGKLVLKGISLRFTPGTHVILGPNGSGKTTLLRAIVNLVKPLEGKVLVYGKDVKDLRPKELAKIIGYVWQNPYYGFFEESVKREISFILKNTGRKGRWELIDKFGLKGLLNRSPFTLSGGEAKKVSIVSVLIADQPIYLLDEPFEGLDLTGTEVLLNLINEDLKRGKTIVVTSHNPLILNKLRPKSVTVIYDGKVRYNGPLTKYLDSILMESKVIPPSWWFK